MKRSERLSIVEKSEDWSNLSIQNMHGYGGYQITMYELWIDNKEYRRTLLWLKNNNVDSKTANSYMSNFVLHGTFDIMSRSFTYIRNEADKIFKKYIDMAIEMDKSDNSYYVELKNKDNKILNRKILRGGYEEN